MTDCTAEMATIGSDGGNGNDRLYGGEGYNRLYGREGNDQLFGGEGKDELHGGAGNDVIDGGGAKDKLFGGGGRDVVRGGDGDDYLQGGAQGDFLDGGRGNDLISGDFGKDRLEGGLGDDCFWFNDVAQSRPGKKRDTIEDFERGADIVGLINIDAREDRPGDQAFTFIGRAKFSGISGELRFKNERLEADTDGNGEADFEVAIFGVSQMSEFDFLL